MTTDALGDERPTLWRTKPALAPHVYIEGSYFKWLECTDSPEFDEKRRHLDLLWRGVPEVLRAHYERELRSKERHQFFSAYNELWYRHAFEMGGIHCLPPSSTSSGSKPDWHLTSRDLLVAIAECHAPSPSSEDVKLDIGHRLWFDRAFRHLNDKRIRIGIHELTAGSRQPDAKRLSRYLDELAVMEPADESQDDVVSLGQYHYEDLDSGWSFVFTLFIRKSVASEAVQQLVYFQTEDAYWHRGKEILEAALARKSRQHVTAVPVVICIGWNDWKHEPAIEEVCSVVAKYATSLDKRGVCGVFWAKGIYPWNLNAAYPQLLHWGTHQVAPLLSCWTGQAVNVRDIVSA